MAKWNRTVVGSILKGKVQDDGTVSSDYLKIKADAKYGKVLLDALKRAQDGNKDLIVNLESAKSQLADIEKSVASGRLGEEMAAKIRERIAKVPDYVRFELVLLQKLD